MRKAALLLFGLAVLNGSANRIEPEEFLSPERRTAQRKVLEKLRLEQVPLLDELGAIDGRSATVTLYTIDPRSLRRDTRNNPLPQPAGVASFHDWRVLGSAEIQGENDRTQLLAELVKGGRQADSAALAGFLPRFALHIAGVVDQAIDVIVCFESGQAEVYGAKQGKGFITSLEPANYFSRLAQKVGLTLAAEPVAAPRRLP